MVTIKQMAELAGVSPTTVSNVLHGRYQKVSPEKLEQVQKIIAQSHYVSNMAGRLLGNHGSKIIAVIIAYKPREEMMTLQDPFTGTLVAVMEREISRSGYFMMLYSNEDVEECLDMALAWNVEGLILLGFEEEDYQRFKERVQVPVVSVDTYFTKGKIDYINIGLQDYEAAGMMTEYLIAQGHQNIAFLSLNFEKAKIDRERARGVIETAAGYGIKLSENDCKVLNMNRKKREEYLLKLAGEGFCGYTALFFSADYLAIEAMNLYLDGGYQVPKDISIAGFDDVPGATHCRPGLTTVRQDIVQKGIQSVAALLQVIRTHSFSGKDIRLSVEVIKRETVCKIDRKQRVCL